MKAGDTVECINDKAYFAVRRGSTYRVEKVKGCFLKFEGLVYEKYDHFDFRVVEAVEINEAVVTADQARPSAMLYPKTSAERKAMPVYDGCIRYFPAALMLVSALSRKGNEKHNPGEPLHHARGKSADHGNCITRHQMEVGTIDPDTQLDHAVGVAWRALAQLQELAESKYGWPLAAGARLPTSEPQK